jgi:hypothetical protein
MTNPVGVCAELYWSRLPLTVEQNMSIDVAQLTRQIQGNCDIADVNSGGLYSLCGFLLRLRDLYKWEHGLAPWQEPEPASLLEWVEARETLWEGIATGTFEPLTVGGGSFEPFDIEAINTRLHPAGLVYGAGYVGAMKPSFFLAELKESRRLGELQVDIVERELARDLFMAPAMRQGNRIFARRSAMLFFLWDQVLEMRPSTKNALLYAFQHYGLDAEAMRRSPGELGPELYRVAEGELETWIYHEIGEVHESAFDGHLWHEIVATYASSQVEIFARVIKDLLADTHVRGLLGHIVEKRLKASLGFYISFMRSFTRLVFPEVLKAFDEFRSTNDWSAIEEARQRGYAKAQGHAQALIELHEAGRSRGVDWASEQIITTLIEPLGIARAPAGPKPSKAAFA